jgi:nucleotide-binding universal stress UspA family protein
MAGEVLIGYDGSDGGKAALDVAIDLAKQMRQTLLVVYAYEVSQFGGEVQDLAKALRERGNDVNAAAVAAANDQGVSAESVIESGDKADALARLASERGASMIVVGSRGESALKGLFLGSVSHKLLHLSTTPVLVVPVNDGR